MRIGILASHPIQYQAPLFKLLAKKVDLEVYFAHKETSKGQASAGFGVEFDWDIDLLDGYSHTFLKNVAKCPNANCFQGCNTPDIKQIIADEKFDAFIVFGWYLRSYLQAIFACKRHHVPLLVRGDSQLQTPRNPMKRYAKEIFYRWFLRNFTAFLCVGELSAKYYMHYGIPEKDLFFSPHCIDNDWFREQAMLAPSTHNEKDDNNPVLLFVGKFIQIKQPEYFVKAIYHLRKKGIKACGIMVGTGPLENELRSLTNDLNIEPHITFSGFQNQSTLSGFYRNADILVLPSLSETWGLVVNEAMACGLPAIVSDQVGCAPDLIESGETGEVFEYNSLDSLVSAIERFTPVCRSQKVKMAIKNKIDNYSVEAAADGILNTVKNFIK